MSESNCRTCIHCGIFTKSRPRDLCWRCYYDPDIRDLYAPRQTNSRYADYNRKPGPAKEPTSALPGTQEKELVLTARAEAFQELWHPADALPDED